MGGGGGAQSNLSDSDRVVLNLLPIDLMYMPYFFKKDFKKRGFMSDIQFCVEYIQPTYIYI